jgi:hypothetical protein
MATNGVTETIWHFAAYWHIAQDVVLPRLVYLEGGSYASAGDLRAERVGEDRLVEELDDLGTGRLRNDILPDGPGTALTVTLTDPMAGGYSIVKPAVLAPLPTAKAFVPNYPTSPARFEIAHPPAEYTWGGDDKLVQAQQVNWLSDSDIMLQGDETWTVPDVRAQLEDMIEQAVAEVPDELKLPDTDTSTLLNFVVERDTERAETGEPLEHQVSSGRYVNNQWTNEPRPERVDDEDEEEPDGTPKSATAEINNDWPVGQDASLGENEATNAAVIVDTNEMSAGLVVMGDYFSLNGIVQLNVYQDNDRVKLENGTGTFEGAATPVAEADGNTSVNDAEFDVVEVGYSPADRGQGPVQWNIEMVCGDFYDVKSLRQTNYLLDNDVVSQTSRDIYSSVSTGENEQANLGQFWDLSKSYDLIIVCGDYHQTNLIYQVNILLDDDLVELYADDRGVGLGSAVSQAARAGENALLNEALIRTFGSPDFDSMTPDIEALVAAIQAQASYLDPNLAWEILGGSGKLDVLFVTGDYYDINVISQINVMADADVAVQNSSAGVISQDAVSQVASTGGNELLNSAAIVDVGTVSEVQYLGGELYEDMILIQAEIVTNDDAVLYGDTNALAPEVIAFTGDDAGDVPDGLLTQATAGTSQSDIMGGVLS